MNTPNKIVMTYVNMRKLQSTNITHINEQFTKNTWKIY